MTPAQLTEVWSMLDREALAAITRQGPPPVFATISGAHLYGFASPDSDVDLRGAFMLPARDLLGLHPSAETVTIEDKTTIDLDWVAHDIRKFARMMVSHNGYVLEQLYSPLVVLSTPAFIELCELGRGCITRPTVKHYLGFAHGRRKRLAEPEATIKHLLYAYRVYLSGIHLMRTGEVLKNWHSYQTWQTERNAARAELERRYGYDTKHAMHLVRLMRMGLEILQTGELEVRRKDAAELSEIRDGALDYEALLTLATQLQRGLTDAVRLSHLPDDVDFARVDELAISLARDPK